MLCLMEIYSFFLYVSHNRVSHLNLIVVVTHITIPKYTEKQRGNGCTVMRPRTYISSFGTTPKYEK